MRGPDAEDAVSGGDSPAQAPGSAERGVTDQGVWDRVRRPGMLRSGVETYLYSAMMLLANLISGVVSARALGPSGRGVAVALVSITQLGGFLFSMGVAQSLSLFIARRPQDGPSLLSAWAIMLVPLTVAAVLLGELLLPQFFTDHNHVAVSAGRWFMVTIVLVVAGELNNGLLLGMHDFTIYNVLRFLQPALMAGSFVVLWRLGALDVTAALVAPTAATGLVLAIGLTRSIQRVGFGPPDLRLGARTAWYGLRGQGTLVATHVNARLDVAMLPAYVVASSVGLYSVATNISLIVYTLSNTLASLLIPAAARDPERGPKQIIAALFASLAVAGLLALAIGLLSEPLLSLVYGSSFSRAAVPLRLLLPGAVLFAGSSIISAGIYAAGRPALASVTQLLGMIVTVVGLLVFLRRGGITAAALVSTASYATVFVASLVAFKHVTGAPWRSFVPTPSRLQELTT